MIKISRVLCAVVVAGFFFAFSPAESLASDRSIRCGGYLIHAGGGKDAASMYEVLKKCGEPEAKYGDTWIYIQGSMRRELTFNYEGRLLRIESRRN